MPEPKRKVNSKAETDLRLEGFETFFDGASPKTEPEADSATAAGGGLSGQQIDKLIDRFSQLLTLTVDQRVETASIASQLIDNQRQLIATQQILIRLMEKSIELTRHITGIEEKLPALFEMPKTVEALRVRVAELEGVEIA